MKRFVILPLLLSLGCASADGSAPIPPEQASPEAHREPSCPVTEGVEYLAWQDADATHVMRKQLATSASVVRTLPADVWFADFPSGQVYVDPATMTVCEI